VRLLLLVLGAWVCAAFVLAPVVGLGLRRLTDAGSTPRPVLRLAETRPGRVPAASVPAAGHPPGVARNTVPSPLRRTGPAMAGTKAD
jgi:hypothetical protein